MKKYSQRLVLLGLFALSIGAAGAVLAQAALAGPVGPPPLCSSVSCDANNGCLGTGDACNCQFNGGDSFSCVAND